jgi:5'-nucleotidase
MKILLSNDDGYQAPGIVALYEAIRDLGEVEGGRAGAQQQREVERADAARAAVRERGGQRLPLRQRHAGGLRAHRADGPARLPARPGGERHQQRRQHGRRHDLFRAPVGAAMEGYLFGVPAIAFSQTRRAGPTSTRRRKARELVQFLGEHHRTDGAHWLLNVNIPNKPYAELKPFKVCRLGRRHAAEKVIAQTSPRGDVMYWIGGAGRPRTMPRAPTSTPRCRAIRPSRR